MMKRIAVVAALTTLAACAGVQPVGRTARSGEPVMGGAASPAEAPALPPPTQQAAAPDQRLAPPPAETAQAEPSSAPQDSGGGDDDNGAIVVPGQREMQVPPPNGDPRSAAERMQDVRTWDRCVTDAQATDSDPMRPQFDTPEEYCRQALGMASRTGVPASRLQQRRR
jgi:hypothetical protein